MLQKAAVDSNTSRQTLEEQMVTFQKKKMEDVKVSMCEYGELSLLLVPSNKNKYSIVLLNAGTSFWTLHGFCIASTFKD